MLVLERLVYPVRARILELRHKGLSPSDAEICKWSAQAAEGMDYFHSKGVLQVDIGLHNMFFDWDDNVKYCDFSGSSVDGERPLVAVSPHAQHPDTYIRNGDAEAAAPPTVQSEIFSLGSAIYEISTTHKAYEGLD